MAGRRDALSGDEGLLVGDADGDGSAGGVAVGAERGAGGHGLERGRGELLVVAHRRELRGREAVLERGERGADAADRGQRDAEALGAAGDAGAEAVQRAVQRERRAGGPAASPAGGRGSRFRRRARAA